MSNRMSSTPEFLRWALRHDCALRSPAPAEDVEKVARQLFVLRACGEAIAAGRECDGYALEQSACAPETVGPHPLGFRIADVLDAYGGRARVEASCLTCPVNLGRRADRPGAKSPWVGCYGLVDWTSLGASWLAQVEILLPRVASRESWHAAFLPTRPSWYGLWAHSPLQPEQLDLLARLLSACVETGPAAATVFQELLAAVRVAREDRRELWVKLFPRGMVEGQRWRVAAHCGRCGAERAEGSHVCPVCGLVAAPRAARRRAAQGTRPYWPLDRILGPERTAALLQRYWQERGDAS